ncbi:eCIS core domain-containing protein [Streptomyces erythrochromogenes]|uniref:eCIS core domain-containing protein n=1 Tax=Streptomyces erythrochromogenes TaxID=285574 RepID=UPI0036AD8EAE
MSPKHPRPTQKSEDRLLQTTRGTAAPQQGAAAPVGLMGVQAGAGNAAVVQMLRRAGHGQDQEQEQHRHTDGCGHQQPQQHAVQRSAVHDVLRAPGRPMDAATRSDMEARLGADFSDVRIHDNSAAKASAAEVGARAYTSGNHVVIGSGGGDKHTLAHELTHVIQQRQGPVAGTDNGSGLKVSDPSDRFEREAEANAGRVMAPGHRAATADVQPHAAPSSAAGSHHAVQRVANPQDLLTVEHWEDKAGLGGSSSSAAKAKTAQIAASKKNAKGWKASKPPRRIDEVIATVGPKLLADLAKMPEDSGRMELYRSMSFDEAHSALTYWGDAASRTAMVDYIASGQGTAKEFRQNGYSGMTIGAHLGDQGQADVYYNNQSNAAYTVQLKFILKPGAHELLYDRNHMALGPGYKNDLIRKANGGEYQNATANEGALPGYIGLKAEDHQPYSLGIAQGANTKNGRELGASQLLFQLFVENVEVVKNRSGQDLPGAAAQQEVTA